MSHATTVDFPSGIPVADVRLRLRDAVSFQESPWSFRRETQVWPGQRWELELQFTLLDRDESAALESFLLGLRTGGTWRQGDPYRSLPRGKGLGLPTVLSASAGSETLATQNWTPNVVDQVKAGDLLELDGSLYHIREAADSDGSGQATLTVAPHLRADYAAGTTVVLDNPRGTWRLAASDAPQFGRQTAGWFSCSSIQAVEAL